MGTAGLRQTGNLVYSGRLCGCRLYPGSVQGTECQMETGGLQQTGTTDRQPCILWLPLWVLVVARVSAGYRGSDGNSRVTTDRYNRQVTLYTLAASVGAGCTQGQCRVQRVRWEQQGHDRQVTLYTLAASVDAGCTQGQCRVQSVRWKQEGYNRQVQQTGNLVCLCGCWLYPGSVQGTEGQMGTTGLQQTGTVQSHWGRMLV